ncbi:VOC family protein [Nocardia brevicatena]|uniref:VOC family protein n=1 Tax=Nocardia brevicatena TaxID=37327 RepID=UPI0002F24A23|nr:VOC family protein [Nocardia brevicatena]
MTAVNETSTKTTPAPTVWPCLAFRDARGTADFLVKAFGFELTAVYARDDDPSVVEHGELRWPLGGGVMFGTADKATGLPDRRQPGAESVYVVCSDPDALYERATAAGAETVRGLRDEDYGSRGFTVADPEGNQWSFGTYRGH